MSSSEAYLKYTLDLLESIDGITYRKMMGEYVLYINGKVFGGIYDDTFLIKETSNAGEFLNEISTQKPYPKGKDMIVVDFHDKDMLKKLIEDMEKELEYPKKKGIKKMNKMDKLSDYPNIGKILEEQLNKIGINTYDELLKIGSKEAWKEIKENVDQTSCLHKLTALEGAVEGIKKSELSKEVKEDLKRFYNAQK